MVKIKGPKRRSNYKNENIGNRLQYPSKCLPDTTSLYKISMNMLKVQSGEIEKD